MPISIPTDSLNKFFTIGSIVALIFLLNITVNNYTKIELNQIEAMAKAEELHNLCEDICPKVDHLKKRLNDYQIRSNGLKNKRNMTKIQSESLTKEIISIQKEIKEMKPLIDKGIITQIQLHRYTRTGILLEKLSNFWLYLSFLIGGTCSIFMFIGLIGWRKESNQKPI